MAFNEVHTCTCICMTTTELGAKLIITCMHNYTSRIIVSLHVAMQSSDKD